MFEFLRPKPPQAPAVNPQVLERNFPLDRLPSLAQIYQREQSAHPEAEPINLPLPSGDFLELHGRNTVEPERLVRALDRLGALDNQVQQFCREAYTSACARLSAKIPIRLMDYVVLLSWAEFQEDGEFLLAYWGEYVNIELRALFAWENGDWQMREAFYA
ncbi:MAG: hypothetical protein HFF50_04810 [Lawsonibacter sp.]|nr:hypothetical protein [Lawsonibacter sp.]